MFCKHLSMKKRIGYKAGSVVLLASSVLLALPAPQMSRAQNHAQHKAGNPSAVPPLEGIYLINDFHLNLNGDFDMSYEPYLLLKDGTVYKGVPTVPPADWDVAASRAEMPRRWGRWQRQSGGGLILIWSDGKRKEYKRMNYLRANPARPGESLHGNYSFGAVSTSRNGGHTSQLAAWSGLRFLPDGRFEQGGGSSFSDTQEGRGGLIAGSRKGKGRSGTYTLSGYTLTRKYDDGEVTRSWYYAPTDDRFYLGATLYHRERNAP